MLEQYSLPIDQLPTSLQWILQQAEANYKLAGGLCPSVYVEAHDGKVVEDGSIAELSDPVLLRHKDLTAHMMTVLAALGFKSVTLACEAWMLLCEGGPSEAPLNGELHKHPDRVEVLQVSYNSPTGDIMAYLPVSEGKATGTWHAIRCDPMPEDMPEEERPRFNDVYSRIDEVRQRPDFEAFRQSLLATVYGQTQ